MRWEGYDNWLAMGKLTKKFLMELPENAYIWSNSFSGTPDNPRYEEKVEPLSKREDQWKRIKAASVDQCVCTVFKNKKEYNVWIKNLMKEYSKRKA